MSVLSEENLGLLDPSSSNRFAPLVTKPEALRSWGKTSGREHCPWIQGNFLSIQGRESIYSYRGSFGEGNGTPLQHSCLENPMDGGARWAAVHGVAKSWTRLSDFTFTFNFHVLEKEMATHSSVFAWRIPWTGEPVGLPSMGSHRVGHDWSDLAAAVAAEVPWGCQVPA